MDNLKKMGLRIKAMRKELDLTQEELAEKLHVGRSAIAGYEVGKIGPKNKIKIELCKLFNCNIDYLMGISDKKEPQNSDLIEKVQKLERQIKIKDKYLAEMWFLGADYDGYESIDGLKSVIDELVQLSLRAGANDDKYAMYEGCGNKFYNILHEEVTAPKEEYLKDEE